MPPLIASLIIISVAWVVVRPVIILPVAPVAVIGPVIGPVRIIAMPDIDGYVDTRVRFMWLGEKQGQNERTGKSNAT